MKWRGCYLYDRVLRDDFKSNSKFYLKYIFVARAITRVTYAFVDAISLLELDLRIALASTQYVTVGLQACPRLFVVLELNGGITLIVRSAVSKQRTIQTRLNGFGQDVSSRCFYKFVLLLLFL